MEVHFSLRSWIAAARQADVPTMARIVVAATPSLKMLAIAFGGLVAISLSITFWALRRPKIHRQSQNPPDTLTPLQKIFGSAEAIDSLPTRDYGANKRPTIGRVGDDVYIELQGGLLELNQKGSYHLYIKAPRWTSVISKVYNSQISKMAEFVKKEESAILLGEREWTKKKREDKSSAFTT